MGPFKFNLSKQDWRGRPEDDVISKSFFKKKWAIPGLFFFILSNEKTVESKQMFYINLCQ